MNRDESWVLGIGIVHKMDDRDMGLVKLPISNLLTIRRPSTRGGESKEEMEGDGNGGYRYPFLR
jgi:hypothetical protein